MTALTLATNSLNDGQNSIVSLPADFCSCTLVFLLLGFLSPAARHSFLILFSRPSSFAGTKVLVSPARLASSTAARARPNFSGQLCLGLIVASSGCAF
jgi:hypothetical protein